jgi:hypothetical protein
MATARARQYDTESLARAGALVAVCTLVLTASFVGLVALLSAAAPGVGTRLPLYVLGTAGAFVTAIVFLEARHLDGERIITTAGLLAVGTFVFATLSGEGLMYVVRNPGELVASQMAFYFLAAGMIATGVGYWAINHWDELGVTKGIGPRSASRSFRR